MIKLIVIDLDGTLLNSQQQMTERTEQTLRRAISHDVKVILATGKTRYAGESIINRLKLTTPGIYLQGLSVHYPDNSIRHQSTLNPDVLRRIITFVEDRGFEIVAYSGQRLLVRQSSPAASELHHVYGEPEPEAVGPLQNLLGTTAINKIVVIKRHDPRKITALRWQLSAQLDAKKEARMTQALADMLEILPPGGSKGTVLKTLLKEMDIKPEEVLAIGDGENDLEMIQLAGIGIAMGNGSEKLKAAADYVVSTNDADGVAEAVERFVLKPIEDAALASVARPVQVSLPDTEAMVEAVAESTAAAAAELLKTPPDAADGSAPETVAAAAPASATDDLDDSEQD